MDLKGPQAQFPAPLAHFAAPVDVVRAGLADVMWVNQVKADTHSVVLNDLVSQSVRGKLDGMMYVIRFLSAFLNRLLASSVPMRLLESSSSLEDMPAPFLSFVGRAGSVASSSLESPSCHRNHHIRPSCNYLIQQVNNSLSHGMMGIHRLFRKYRARCPAGQKLVRN